MKICLPGSMRFLILSRPQRNEWLRFRHCSSTSKIIAAQGKSISSTVSLDIAKSSLRNTVRKSQFIKRQSKPLTNCRSQSSRLCNRCMRSFISWQSRRKTHNLLHKMCSLSFIQRKRLTNIFNETSKPSSFCCLPIITIGVVDYRHCNQKNLKIYLSTLHKSV